MSVQFKTLCRIMRVEERFNNVYKRGSGFGEHAAFEQQSTGWWAVLPGNIALHLGEERPNILPCADCRSNEHRNRAPTISRRAGICTLTSLPARLWNRTSGHLGDLVKSPSSLMAFTSVAIAAGVTVPSGVKALIDLR